MFKKGGELYMSVEINRNPDPRAHVKHGPAVEMPRGATRQDVWGNPVMVATESQNNVPNGGPDYKRDHAVADMTVLARVRAEINALGSDSMRPAETPSFNTVPVFDGPHVGARNVVAVVDNKNA